MLPAKRSASAAAPSSSRLVHSGHHKGKSVFSLFGVIFGSPDLKSFPLKRHSYRFSLDRLLTGIDNYRFDVLLSPAVCKAAYDMTYQLLLEKAEVGDLLGIKQRKSTRERQVFAEVCRSLLFEGINTAKQERNMQIDSLVQITVSVMVFREMESSFAALTEQLKRVLWQQESTSGQFHAAVIELRDRLKALQKGKQQLFLDAGASLFQQLNSVQHRGPKEMRESVLGTDMLSDDIFSNPIIPISEIDDPFFLMEEYGLLFGNRDDDPDHYDRLIGRLKALLAQIDPGSPENADTPKSPQRPGSGFPDAYDQELAELLMQPENISTLLDHERTGKRIKRLKAGNEPKHLIKDQKQLQRLQKKVLHTFTRQLKADRIRPRATALAKMKPIYRDYCPPLVPHQVFQFLIHRNTRKGITRRLARLKGFYGHTLTAKPLRKAARNVKRVPERDAARHLIRYLINFSRYHRDRTRYAILKDCMEKINLLSDDKAIALSRANHTLYSFMMPEEETPESAAVRSHVIVKADVRGSTDITYRLKQRELNPASYFSLNFFDPITHLLDEFGAEKVFIEGDAIILAILEKEKEPEQWYGVSRACGLAVDMLQVIQRYNQKSLQNGLPVIELGIGIVYQNGSPTFLFDGDNRIMISPAINLADRLSGSSRPLKRRKLHDSAPFNLYVYETASEPDTADTADDLSIRYNVNGIELDGGAFAKLTEEITLKKLTVKMTGLPSEEVLIHTGKFPTASGHYQRIVIREAQVQRMDKETYRVTEIAGKPYYEVSTHPQLYKAAE